MRYSIRDLDGLLWDDWHASYEVLVNVYVKSVGPKYQIVDSPESFVSPPFVSALTCHSAK